MREAILPRAPTLYVTRDATVYRDELERSCSSNAQSTALLLLVPMRLALDALTTAQCVELQRLCRLEHFAGLIGGRAHGARFVFGAAGGKLSRSVNCLFVCLFVCLLLLLFFFLFVANFFCSLFLEANTLLCFDPHSVQKTVDMTIDFSTDVRVSNIQRALFSLS